MVDISWVGRPGKSAWKLREMQKTTEIYNKQPYRPPSQRTLGEYTQVRKTQAI